MSTTIQPAAAAWLLLRDRADRPVPQGTVRSRLAAVLRLPATWQLSFLYAVAFGGLVAFSVYLPTYLTSAYHLDKADAAIRTAGFVVLAVGMRPVGGWLSDRLDPVRVLLGSYGAATVLAVLAALQLTLVPVAATAFLGIALALGLGGFFPPLVMGSVYGLTGSYFVGFLLLAATVATATALTATSVRHRAAAPA